MPLQTFSYQFGTRPRVARGPFFGSASRRSGVGAIWLFNKPSCARRAHAVASWPSAAVHEGFTISSWRICARSKGTVVNFRRLSSSSRRRRSGPVGSAVSRQPLARRRDGSSAGLIRRRHLRASFLQRGAGAAAQRLRAEAASTASSSAAGFSGERTRRRVRVRAWRLSARLAHLPLIVNRRMDQLYAATHAAHERRDDGKTAARHRE